MSRSGRRAWAGRPTGRCWSSRCSTTACSGSTAAFRVSSPIYRRWRRVPATTWSWTPPAARTSAKFGFDRHRGEQPRTTWVRVDPDGSVVRAADDLLFPNGTVMTPDGRTLIVAETFASRLTVFDVGADGALSGRRLFARIEGCFPDGICRDAERAVWWPTPGQPGDPRAPRRAGRPDDLDRTPRSVRLHAGRRRPTDPVRVHQQGQRSRHGPRDRPAHRGLPGRRSRRRASLVSRGPRPGPVARDVSAVPWCSRDGRTGSWPPDVSTSTAHRRRTG
jgi:hypothetical protein